MQRVAMCGFAESWREAPFDDSNVRILGLNELYKYLPRWDEWIEIHDEDSIGLTRRAIGQAEDEVRAHREWLTAPKDANQTIWMQERFCDGRFPAAKPYPISEVLFALSTKFKRPDWEYLTSTVAAGLALLLTRGRDASFKVIDETQAVEWIGLYGIELIGQGEYQYQRPCAEMLIGLAIGLGIDVYVPEVSALLQSDHLYGFQKPETELGALRRSKLVARRAALQKQRSDLIANVKKFDGAITELENWITVTEGVARGVKKLPDGFMDESPKAQKTWTPKVASA